jgi:RHH-type proline utilization regulon transcriptional repressor/proline dehydrogenase/delta 1-pyrroline-5-carboxylate dehydrogenase
LTKIYQQAIDYPFEDDNGVKKDKFVNLDMEEYKNTELHAKINKELEELAGNFVIYKQSTY